MSVREFVTHARLTPVFNANINTNTTTNTAGIDTANDDLGITWYFQAVAFSAGTFAISFEESDASNFTGATAVPSEKIVGPTGAELTTAQQQLTAATAVDGSGSAVRLGVHSNRRYVRAVITSTGASGTNTINVSCLRQAETIPAVA